VGRWEADLVICRRSRPVLVLHERKTRITLMARLAGKTAAETVAAMMATFRPVGRDRLAAAGLDGTVGARGLIASLNQ
jgi:IS30 family transposase